MWPIRLAIALLHPSESRVRLVLVALVATLLFVWVSLYRFNTLGGSLGGFDNDHFLHFAYAKQVEAGEQPLRDFLDAGLQGAWPSLTYELSAAAQKFFGDNLRSEAWLTVAGVAAGAAIAFVVGSRLAPWPWALATALLSGVISPKLYAYPKVLVLAVTSWLIVEYVASPTRWRLALMVLWTGVAFLFRNDYAVYAGVGCAAAIVAAHRRDWRQAIAQGALYALLTIVVLGPSLWWIQRYRGIPEYVRNAAEMSRYEAERTPLSWPKPSLADASSVGDLLQREENTEAWLYYTFFAIPIVGIAVALTRRVRRGPAVGQETAQIVVLCVFALVAERFLLRSNLEARLGDVAPPVAIIGAFLLGLAAARRGSAAIPYSLRATTALLVLVVSTACVWTLESVASNLATGRLLASPFAMAERASRVSEELAALPAALRREGPRDRMGASDYLYQCTRPSDRVLVVAYAPEVPVFAERRFGGGRAAFFWGFYRDERYSREMIGKLRTESVPIVLADIESFYDRLPLIAPYLREHYVDAGQVMTSGRPLRVLVQHGKVGRPSGPGGLPCFT